MLEKKSNFDPERFKSAKKLKADDGFKPYPVNTGDELYPNGIFEFNVTKIIKDIENDPNKFDLCEIVIGDFPEGLSCPFGRRAQVDFFPIVGPAGVVKLTGQNKNALPMVRI